MSIQSVGGKLTSNRYALQGFRSDAAISLALNRPFPSSRFPQFQNESKCETIHMEMSSFCMRMKMQVKHIFI